jgi:hypothetical protein
MNKTEMVNKFTRTFYKVGFQIKKHSPEILAGVGVVGTVASTVIACKATTKVSEILEESKGMVEQIHECANDTELVESGKYTVEDKKKDLAITYIQTGVKIARLYAPAVILGAASLTCLLTSNNILRKRSAASAAAYATVYKSFKEYRDRVAERYGEETERELKHNVRAIEIEETVIDEKGNETTVKKTIQTVDPSTMNDYTRIFDEFNSTEYEKNADYNFNFLRARQKYANDLLVSRGYLFFNEVLEMLGMDQIPEGQIMGWVYTPNDPEAGDNYVDFGIYDYWKENTRDFIEGRERAIILEFNFDGYILDKVKFTK